MPTDPTILTFGSRWYDVAFESSTRYELPSGMTLRLISPPLFICTKIDAFRSRGASNDAESQDIEDVITVIDGRPELCVEIEASRAEVGFFIAEEFRQLLADTNFVSNIEWHLPLGAGGTSRVPIVESRMQEICQRNR